jgi:histidine ammonia-lyase
LTAVILSDFLNLAQFYFQVTNYQTKNKQTNFKQLFRIMAHTLLLNQQTLSLADVQQLLQPGTRIQLGEQLKQSVLASRAYLDQKMTTADAPIYGINTGFGSLCDVKISPDNLTKLQENLVRSHACGAGAEVPLPIVRLMLALKIQSLGYGYSSVQWDTIARLADFYNEGITPIVYTQGSLGASGDLAPLAHLALPLIGEGEVYENGHRRMAQEVLAERGWAPIQLQSKEGLALLNGTQFMSAYGCYTLVQAHRISRLADVIGAVSLEGFDGRIDPFHPALHAIRPHQGQQQTAQNINELLADSSLIKQPKKQVQDPYSFRCMPQVHGASKDAIAYVTNVFLTEINSVTDNPTVFQELDLILSGGNFHGQPLALALDFLAIALAELGSISERRTYQLISGLRGLPPFLVDNPGLNSGFMIPQYTAASIVSLNKQLASPSSIDSIVSSNGQEDHVSMGANAAVKTAQIASNVDRVLAIELFNASQAIHYRQAPTSSYLTELLRRFRKVVPLVTEDRILHYDMEEALAFVQGFTDFELKD